ncbi:MAG TPA: amidohydrolase family protein [Beijerinckiaceae bacterium]|jgi:predicted TIM-barrel fold metal-dependent hydrolase|nr:amidohydrolase family protein [Beijerinckiaceae bacterium]
MNQAEQVTGLIDCHAHCYDLDRYHFSETSGFALEANAIGSSRQYQGVLDAHGVSHAVLINPLGGYGTDNRYLLEAIAGSQGRFKGIVLLAEDATDAQVKAMVDGGIVGLRFNLNFPSSPSLYGPAGERALAIARENGWVVLVHYEGDTILEALPVLRRSGCPVIIDHSGRPSIAAGLDQPSFRALLAFGREGQGIIKLSGAFRMSRTGWPFEDCDPYMQALIEAFGLDRCIWGSDWPFVRPKYRVDYGPLLAYFRRLVPNAADQQRILWSNPARLFGFQ